MVPFPRSPSQRFARLCSREPSADGVCCVPTCLTAQRAEDSGSGEVPRRADVPSEEDDISYAALRFHRGKQPERCGVGEQSRSTEVIYSSVVTQRVTDA
ncbi:hypothetical protein GN956_G25887 [Arapaima gigas]